MVVSRRKNYDSPALIRDTHVLDAPTPPVTHSIENMLLAVDRLGAGLGGTMRLPMSLGRAQDIMRDVARELVLLREETREWVCTKCKLMYSELPKPVGLSDGVVGTCPKCGAQVRPAVVIRQAALLDKIRESQERIERLEESLTTILDFYGNVEESSST